jgi:hypothetical protein
VKVEVKRWMPLSIGVSSLISIRKIKKAYRSEKTLFFGGSADASSKAGFSSTRSSHMGGGFY